MIITVANVSTQVANVDFQAAVAAIGEQVTKHFQPEWNLTADIKGIALSLGDNQAPIQGDHDAIIYLGDSSQDPTTGVDGALGYHSVNYGNIPYGFVYLDIVAEYDEKWTVTLSHEVLELLGDPTATLTVTGPAPNNTHHLVHYDLEVCDPTQGDSYSIDAVDVSNFVGRSYFGLSGGSGRLNYLGLPLVAFGVRPNGYFQYEDSTGAHQIEGAEVTDRTRTARKKMGKGRRNQRRKTGGNMQTLTRRSLRETLATDPDLRHRVYQAATIAAYRVLKEAGVTVTNEDVADAQADVAAMKSAEPAIRADTAGDIIDGVGTAVSIGIALGF